MQLQAEKIRASAGFHPHLAYLGKDAAGNAVLLVSENNTETPAIPWSNRTGLFAALAAGPAPTPKTLALLTRAIITAVKHLQDRGIASHTCSRPHPVPLHEVCLDIVQACALVALGLTAL